MPQALDYGLTTLVTLVTLGLGAKAKFLQGKDMGVSPSIVGYKIHANTWIHTDTEIYICIYNTYTYIFRVG
jgi:hypothetical protein